MAEIFPNFKKTLSPQNRRCSTDLEDKHGKKKSRYITIKFRSSAGEKNLKTNKRKKKDILHTMKQKLTMTGMKGNLQDRKQ